MDISGSLFSAAFVLSIQYCMAQYALEPFLVTSRYRKAWLIQHCSYQEESTLAIHSACEIAAQMEARSQKPSAVEHFSSA